MTDHQLPKRFGYTNTGTKNYLQGNKVKKFEHTMKSMQKIKTFVDLTQRLKQLNPLQHKQFQLIISHLKQQAKLKKFFKKEDDKNIIEISKKLELEIDILNNIEDQNLIIDILQLDFTPQQIATMIQESTITLETHHNLHQLQEKINKRSFKRQSNNRLDRIDQINFLKDGNNDQQDFYRETINSFNQKRNLLQSDELSVNQKFELLKQYLQEKGIEIEKKEKVPHLSYSNYYAQQANKLIKSTKLKQLRQIHIGSPKSASISPELLSPQMYHTNKKLDKFEYQTSNNQSSTTMNTPQLTPSKLLKQKSVEYQFQSQHVQCLTERVPPPKRKSEHQVAPVKSMLLTQVEQDKDAQPTFIKQMTQTVQPQSHYHKSLDSLREFQANTKAVQTFFRMENKDFLSSMRDMEKILKKPLKQHFNEFMTVHQDEDEAPDCVGKRKNNQKRNIRLNKIFKSELE